MKIKIVILTVIIVAIVLSAFIFMKNSKGSDQNFSTGIYDNSINYVSNTNSSADRFISTLREQLIEYPDNTNLLTKLGAAYIQKARETNDPEFYDLAEDVLDRAIQNNPDNFLAIAELGSVNLSRHNFKQALELSNEAIRLNPYNSYSYGVLVDAQVELGMYDEAIASLQKMINTRPDLGSYSRVSYLRELKGDHDGAIDAMKSAIEAGSPATENVAWCRVQLGNLYLNKGESGDAEKIFNSVIKDFPNYAHGYGNLAKIKMHDGKFSEAAALLTKALEINALPEFMISLGDAYKLTGENEKAEEQYSKVKFLNTLFKEKGVDTDLELALFNADHNRSLNESLSDAEENLENGSHSIKTYHSIAWLNYKLGNFQAAEENIRLALRLGTKDPLLSYHAGKIFLKTGRADESGAHLKYALAIYPHFENLYAE